MLGSLFAGTEEAPGKVEFFKEEVLKHIGVWDLLVQ